MQLNRHGKLGAICLMMLSLLALAISVPLAIAEQPAAPEAVECSWLNFDENNPDHFYGFRCFDCHSYHKAAIEDGLLLADWEEHTGYGDGRDQAAPPAAPEEPLQMTGPETEPVSGQESQENTVTEEASPEESPAPIDEAERLESTETEEDGNGESEEEEPA